MVKSGEVHQSPCIENEGDFVVNTDARPRNICVPSNQGCGFLTALQSTWWA